ncbi:MAG: hypothetical protein R2792_03175 [Saprospiraceae bacterium]
MHFNTVFENYRNTSGYVTQLQLAHGYTFMGSNSCQNTMQMEVLRWIKPV